MPIPPAIDPRLLAAEICAAVSEFNRLANLADQLGLAVEVEVLHQQTPEHQHPRPVLMVQVVSPL
ncbi:hypothetical protein [Phenylobacterium sp.]|uniref:hypothetical protein n=1 Tax=Phenylobacterium sp. TaxID=1871053 RepID=UPI002ED81AC9